MREIKKKEGINVEITFKKMKKENVEVIRVLSNSIWYNTYEKILPKEVIDEHTNGITEEYVKEINNRGNGFWKMVLYNEQIVGYIIYHIEENCLFLGELYLKKEYQNQGIGTHIIHFLKHSYSSLPIGLHVVATNTLAYNFYKKCGFEEKQTLFDKRDDTYIPLKLMLLH